MKTNYVLIDYENVQPEISTALADEHFNLLIFIGANQPRIDVDVAAAVQRLGPRADYVRISGAGRNALDFHIAYYLGRLVCAEPDAYFHVIALDKGYDPLFEHLKIQGIHASRWADVKDIPIVRTNGEVPTEDKLSTILAYLLRRGVQRPGTVKTLTGSVAALFPPKLQDAEVAGLLEELQRNGVFVVNGTRVTYALPE